MHLFHASPIAGNAQRKAPPYLYKIRIARASLIHGRLRVHGRVQLCSIRTGWVWVFFRRRLKSKSTPLSKGSFDFEALFETFDMTWSVLVAPKFCQVSWKRPALSTPLPVLSPFREGRSDIAEHDRQRSAGGIIVTFPARGGIQKAGRGVAVPDNCALIRFFAGQST